MDKLITIGDLFTIDELQEQEFFYAKQLRESFESKDIKEEVVYLEKLGKIYLARATKGHDGTDYVKAAALYNAALARCAKLDGVGKPLDSQTAERLAKQISRIEQTYIAEELKTSVKATRIHSQHILRKKKLENLRQKCDKDMEKLQKSFSAYERDNQTQEEKKDLELKRSEGVRQLYQAVSEEIRSVAREHFEECLQMNGRAPCEYALMSMGSLATETITPFSDLELAILLEDSRDSEEIKSYFRKVVYLMYIQVVNYGETILPIVLIDSLADNEDKYNCWFKDFITPKGFSFDGRQPWASKTPIGRRATATKPQVELIRTPKNMASLQLDELRENSAGYNLIYALLNVSLVTGSEKLLNEYKTELATVLEKKSPECVLGEKLERILCTTFSTKRLLAINRLADLLEKFNTEKHLEFREKFRFDVKNEIYRLPSMITTVFGLLFNISENNPWKVIEEMNKNNVIQEDNKIHLQTLISIATELRLKSYLYYRKQKEEVTGLKQMCKTSSNVPDVLQIYDTQMIFRFYSTVIPLQKSLRNILESLYTRNSSDSVKFPSDILYENEEEIKRECFLKYGRYREYIQSIDESAYLNRPTDKKTESNNTSMNLLISKEEFIGALDIEETSLVIKGEGGVVDIARTLNNHGYAFHNLGNFEKAVTFYEESLAMYREIYGQDKAHPRIASSLGNLGTVFHKLGKFEKAVTFGEESLAMRREIYGQNSAHSDIAASLNNLGDASTELGNFKKAVTFGEESLAMRREIYGQNSAHPDIAASLNNLGMAFEGLGNFEKAVTFYEESLAMRREIYGRNSAHPDIAQSLNNLGGPFARLGNFEKAVTFYEESLAMRREIYGQSAHPDIATSLNNLGGQFAGLGNFEKAVTFHEESLAMCREIYGQNSAHPDIANSLNNLGIASQELGNFEKAVTFGEESLAMRREIYGQNSAHPDIATSLNNLGYAFAGLGNFEKAVTFYEVSGHVQRNIRAKQRSPKYCYDTKQPGKCIQRTGKLRKGRDILRRVSGHAQRNLRAEQRSPRHCIVTKQPGICI